MKLGTRLVLGASGLACLGLVTALGLPGCSSSNNNNNNNNTTDGGGGSGSGGSGSDGGSSGGYTSAQPPALPTGASATTLTTPHNFALHHIHLGDESTFPWQGLGYDIDHLNTSATTTTGVCTQATGAPKKYQEDGNNGIDNAFGNAIVPIIGAVAPNPSSTISSSIVNGSFTLMLNLVGLDSTSDANAIAQTASGLTGQLFGGVQFDQGPNAGPNDASLTPPTFTVADNWPLNPATLAPGQTAGDGGSLTQPVKASVAFSNPYVVSGTFVSGSPSEVQLALSLEGNPLTLDIKHAVITFQHDKTTNATSGIISGVLVTSEFVSQIQALAGSLKELCNAQSVVEDLITAINQASDILQDGTNVAGTPCDAISIGMGFDADEIGQPQFEGVPTAPVNACGDGGTAGDEDGGASTAGDAGADAAQ